MKEPVYYVNGRFIPKSEARVSLWDMGFIRSYGVVEFLITYRGNPFKLGEHINRLFKSLRSIDLDVGISKKKLTSLVYQTLAKNTFSESSIWIVVTGGEGPSSMIPGKNPTLAILIDRYKPYSKKYYDQGIKIITYPAKRILVSAKSMVYTQAIIALKLAYKKNAMEALYFQDGQVTECMTSNFFIIKNGQLFTAPDKDVLMGITRQVVLDICTDKLTIHKIRLSLKHVLNADEAFLTASNKEVMPVVKIDNVTIGNGRVGKYTKKIMEWFTNYTQKQV